MVLMLLHSLILNNNCAIATQVNRSCDFESGLCDGWRQSSADDFDWTRRTGSTASPNTGPDKDHTDGSGYYMYIETSSPRVTGDNAKLELSVSGSGELACLEFYYHMYGVTMGTLNVFSGNVTVFSVSGNHGGIWIMAKRNIYLNKTVTFEGIAGSSFTGDLAIDDVSIRSGGCNISCDFDSSLCYGLWRQSNSSDVFDWYRHTGSTASPNTGPDNDHTSGSGFYAYIEASSPRVAGENAKIKLSVPGNGELYCLKFYYHMYGDTMGTLTVFSGNEVVFNASGSYGQNWLEAESTITLNETVSFSWVSCMAS
ncbi:MAM and LDL-receptor class A domain-containing protein 1-like [Oculina patagonica]